MYDLIFQGGWRGLVTDYFIYDPNQKIPDYLSKEG